MIKKMVNNYNMAAPLDVSSLSYADIAPGICNYRTRVIAKEQNPNKTWSTITRGENWYETPIGEFEEKKWDKIALEVVKNHKDEALLEKIISYVRNHCLWLKENEIEHYSLSCLVRKSYEAWAERGEFKI